MPWWFWIITHVWFASFCVMFVIFVHNEEHKKIESKKDWAFVGLLHLIAPLVFIFALCSLVWDGFLKVKLYEWNAQDNWFIKLSKRFKDRKQKKKDLKEMEDNEDEWRIERLGIK